MTSSILMFTMKGTSLFLLVGIICQFQVRLSASEVTCPDNFQAYDGHCLRMLATVTSVDNAFTACRNIGGRLAAPVTKEDVLSIYSFMEANTLEVTRGAFLSPMLRDGNKVYWRSSGDLVSSLDEELLTKLQQRRRNKPMPRVYVTQTKKIAFCGMRCVRHPLCAASPKKAIDEEEKGTLFTPAVKMMATTPPSNKLSDILVSQKAKAWTTKPTMKPIPGTLNGTGAALTVPRPHHALGGIKVAEKRPPSSLRKFATPTEASEEKEPSLGTPNDESPPSPSGISITPTEVSEEKEPSLGTPVEESPLSSSEKSITPSESPEGTGPSLSSQNGEESPPSLSEESAKLAEYTEGDFYEDSVPASDSNTSGGPVASELETGNSAVVPTIPSEQIPKITGGETLKKRKRSQYDDYVY